MIAIWKTITHPTSLTCWAVGTLLLGFVGPFGMAETTPILRRFLYWFVAIGVGFIAGETAKIPAGRIVSPTRKMLFTSVSALFFSVLFTPFLLGFNSIFYPERMDGLLPPLQLFVFLAFVFFGVGILVVVTRKQFDNGKPAEPVATPDQPATETSEPDQPIELSTALPPELKRKLEPRLRQAKLIRLSMQDHYVEVHTDQGSQLVLMRMSDAAKMLDGSDGLQVHRSHWVARWAVTRAERDNGRLFLRMSDEELVPVSRSYRDAVTAAGLL